MIIDSFDPIPTAILDPAALVERVPECPAVAVSCFSAALFEALLAQYPHEEIGAVETACQRFPIYRLLVNGQPISAYLSAVGAPVCAAQYEEICAMGVQTLILFGTCGVLDRSIEDCAVIVPTAAVRDEGVSYHYLPASEEVAVNPRYRAAFEGILKAHGVTYHEGKVWTTDAIYRETARQMERRRAEGCICVDMEAASMAAVAKFRGREVFQFFYAADNLDAEQWEERSLSNQAKLDVKQKLWTLALELALFITKSRT